MKKYKLINNTLGWLIFIVAAATYLLTIEPTASFWDCPEFIAQGFKTEIGHPPGNPIFILAANFASKFAGGDVMAVAKCVNAMSAIFSALTILLLFWSITHLVKKLVVKDGKEDEMTLAQYLVVMGSGICGALAYTWSDTFWYSAVEAEVYAFSSFCTALVFWLILKWENRVNEPGSDRWIVLIAYVLGVSLGVHLLNLLCIPAIALIFYYRQCRAHDKASTLKGSLLTLLVSFVIVGLILYGLEPGFVELGQKFDLFFVNTLGMSFNSGVLVYAIVLMAALAWALWELYSNKSPLRIKLSFALAILMSGVLFLGDSMLIPLVLFIALCVYLFRFCTRVPVRVFTNIVSCIMVIFIGFSCYALILIRSSQNTPLDENSPNNTYALAKYLSREQYGETPLLYGRTLYSDIMYQDKGNGVLQPATKEGPMQYAPEVKTSPDQPDRYKELGYKYSPEQNMLFPRIHDEKHEREYVEWLGMQGTQVEATTKLDSDGNSIEKEMKTKPTMMENLRFFVDYQLNYMYWRYFMWNFAGRQNDIQGMGEITHGNWISGYSFIDNPRLGDQSLLPDDLGKGNKGHNVFYLLPLLMGIIGLLWQAYRGRRGIEQFWVIFFLFFMTGIAIVLYLNQTPSQPRERDYAYAGSFYAFSIWIGMGVAGLWSLVMWFLKKKNKKEDKSEAAVAIDNGNRGGVATAVAAIAAIIGLIIPLQMVSQTWDDHDRSGRTAARDFGRNYLSSVAPNGVIFCNGDNDTFPLWYLQEVEGYRTDVRAVNLSYLATDWYINQMQRAAYESAPLPMQADQNTYAYDERQFCYFIQPDQTPTDALKSLASIYSPESKNNPYGINEILYPRVFIPVDADQAIKAGVVKEEHRDLIQPSINLDLQRMGSGMTASQLMSFDIIASSIAQGWNRPCYFAMTVPNDYYLGLDPYLRLTGLAYQVTPLLSDSYRGDIGVSTDIMYDNVVNKFLWGGLDKAKPGSLYLDETICRMVTTMRSALIDLASNLSNEGNLAKNAQQAIPAGMTAEAYAADRFKKAKTILDLMMEKLPVAACPFTVQMGEQVAQIYYNLGKISGDEDCIAKSNKILEDEIMRYAGYLRFYQSLDPAQYERLTRIDKYIDQQYVLNLLSDYGQQVDDKKYQEIATKLQSTGVNMGRLKSYQENYERAMRQQYEAERAAAQQQQANEEAPSDLSEVLGN